MYKSFKNPLRIFLILLLIYFLPVRSENVESVQFETIGSNEKFELQINPENLSLKLLVKNSNYSWSSTLDSFEDEDLNETWKNFIQSAITIKYVDIDNNIQTEDLLAPSTKIKLDKIKNGIEAQIKFPSEIGMLIQISLNDNGIKIEIPDDSWIEPKELKLTEVNVYPFLGSIKGYEDESYFFVPDGSGALVSLDEDRPFMQQPYYLDIYGPDLSYKSSRELSSLTRMDLNRAFFPVYGINDSENKEALFSHIESGAEFATLQMQLTGLVTDYNWITSKYTFRSNYKKQLGQDNSDILTLYPEKRNHFSIIQHFIPLSEEDSGYSGMANYYRQYLTSKKIINKIDENPPNIHISFMGGESGDDLFGEQFYSLTRVNDIVKIVDDLLSQPINNLTIDYFAWTSGGWSNRKSNELQIAKKLGSMDELRQLADYLNESNIRFQVQTNPLISNQMSFFDGNKAAIKADLNVLELPKQDYTDILIKTEFLESFKEEFENVFGNTSVSGLSFESFGQVLYSTNEEKDYATRRQMIEDINIFLDDLKSKGYSISVNNPSQYLLQHVNQIYNTPIDSSNSVYFKEDVPFVQMILHGSVPYFSPPINFVGSVNHHLLKSIEYGAGLSFVLTNESSIVLEKTPANIFYSTKYTDWKDVIVDAYQMYEPVFEQVNNSYIINHSRQGELSITTYENGVNIIINHSDVPIDYNGLIVEPQQIEMIEGIVDE